MPPPHHLFITTQRNTSKQTGSKKADKQNTGDTELLVTKTNHASDQSTYRYSSMQRMCMHQDRPNIEARSCNHCCCEKAICIAYSKCVSVAIVILHQSACAILYCHLWLLQQYHIFRRYRINGTIFGKKLLNIKYVFWLNLQILSETFLILRRILRGFVINVKTSSCKAPLILVEF